MDVLRRIKRLVLEDHIQFSDKALFEMHIDDLDEQDVSESILSARAIAKTIRTTSPNRSHAGEKSMSSRAPITKGRQSIRKGASARKASMKSSTSSSRPKTTAMESARPVMTTCVICGSRRVSRKKVRVRFPDGRESTPVVASVCPDCGERYYDMDAMKQLTQQRRKRA